MENSRRASIIVESTPERGHLDQLAIILRYIKATAEVIELSLFDAYRFSDIGKYMENCHRNALEMLRLKFR
jgi:hypothetical protein